MNTSSCVMTYDVISIQYFIQVYNTCYFTRIILVPDPEICSRTSYRNRTATIESMLNVFRVDRLADAIT